MILGGATDIEVIGQAADGHEGVEAARRHQPDVVLMDIRMPRLDGLEATEIICTWVDSPKVIVLTTFDADDYVARALRSGASGFLLKNSQPAAIVDAIRKVADGDPMLSPTVTSRLIARLSAGIPPERSRTAIARLSTLTDREREVADAVRAGMTNSEIAESLFLSVPTVKAHLRQLFVKLEVTNRVQVAICVHDAGAA